jgi:hypothetical protein
MKRAEIDERLAKGERMVVLADSLVVGKKTFEKGDTLPPIASRSLVESWLRSKSAAWDSIKKPAAKKAPAAKQAVVSSD